MEGSHPRAQLPRWRCFRSTPDFRATRPKPKIFLKARVTFCLGPDRARVPNPLLPRRHQAPFSLRDLPQPGTLTVSPWSTPLPAGDPCWEDSGHTHFHPSEKGNSSKQSSWDTGYSHLHLQGLWPGLSTDEDNEAVERAFLLQGLFPQSSGAVLWKGRRVRTI